MEAVAEHIVGKIEKRDVFVGPLGDDLAGELDADRSCSYEKKTIRMQQFDMRPSR